jgi:hypothetical protein
VYDVPDLLSRKRLIFLKENAGSIPNIQLGEEVVILRENEAVCLASVRSDRSIVSPEAEFFDIADPFDIVTEFPQVVDRRPLDIFVSEDAIPH